MKNGKRFLAAVLVAALFMTQPGGTALAAAAGEAAETAVDWVSDGEPLPEPEERSEPEAAADEAAPAETMPESGTVRQNESGETAYTLEIVGKYTKYVKGFDQAPTAPVDVVIPDGVAAVDDYAFEGNEMVRSISFPSSFTEIDSHAFDGCPNLEQVVFRDEADRTEGVVINGSAFRNCAKLEAISIPRGGDSVIYGGVFKGCTGMKRADLGNGVRRILSGAFEGCTGLEAVTLSDGLTEIDERAFAGCTALQALQLPGSLTSIGDSAFQGCTGLISVEHTGTRSERLKMGIYAFAGCTSLKEFSYPEYSTAVVASAFSGCTALERVTLADTITGIQRSAFKGCTSLREIVLPDGLTYIYASAFENCSSLREIAIPGGITQLPEYVFSGCAALERVDLEDGLTRIDGHAFAGCESLTQITLPDTVTTLGTGIFSGSGVTLVDFPAGMTMLPGSTFENCTSLESITLPDGLTAIGAQAFLGCTSLNHVVIPDSVTSIGGEAFALCTALTAIDLPEGPTTLATGLFNAAGLVSLEIPESVTSIGYTVFASCPNLTELTILPSVTSIQTSAFQGCTPANITIRCVSGSYAHAFAEEYGFQVSLLGEEQTRQARAAVYAPDGSAVETGFTVAWYEENGTRPVATGTPVTLADASKTYECRLVLDDALALLYQTPAPQILEPESEDLVMFILHPYAHAQLSGRIVDGNGDPVSSARIGITQFVGGQELSSQMIPAGTDGSFTADVLNVSTSVVVRADGYYSVSRQIQADGEFQLGDIVMQRTVSDRITLELTQVYAALPGEQPVRRSMPDTAGLKFTLTRDGIPVTGYEAQGNALVFYPSVAGEGDTFEITIQDVERHFTAPAVSVTLGADRTGSAQITLTENGSFSLTDIHSAHAANVMIFDGKGQLYGVQAVRLPMQSDPLPAGSYKLVFCEKNAFLHSVPELSQLDALGLSAGRDYALAAVEIRNGEITPLTGVAVPELDVETLTGTVLEQSGVSVTPNQIAAADGLLAYLRISFTLADGTGADAVQISLPEGVIPVTPPVLGTKVLNMAESAERVWTLTGLDGVSSGTVYLGCAVTQAGEYNISASLLAGERLLPLGAAALSSSAGYQIWLPDRTNSPSILIGGTAIPNVAVTIYDNGTEIGRAQSNSNGSWEGEFQLQGPLYDTSYHYIHAAVDAEGVYLREPIQTPSQLVVYDQSMPAMLEQITMYNTGDYGQNTSVFYFDRAGQDTANYRMWPLVFPDFSFAVSFSGDNSQLDQVYVVTEDADGERTYVETVYDPQSGLWTGTYAYYQFEDAPSRVGAVYSFRGSDSAFTEFDSGKTQDHLKAALLEDSQPLADLYGAEGEGKLLTAAVEVDEADHARVRVYETATGQTAFWYDLRQTADSRTAEELEQAGFYSFDADADEYMLVTYGENGFSTQYALPKEQVLITETYEFPGEAAVSLLSGIPAAYARIGLAVNPQNIFSSANIMNWLGSLDKMLTAASVTKDLIQLYEQQHIWRNQLSGNVESLTIDADALLVAVDSKCDDGSYRLPEDERNALRAQLTMLKQDIQDYQDAGTRRIGYSLIAKLAGTIGTIGLGKLVDLNFEYASELVQHAASTGYSALTQFAQILTQYWQPELDDISINGLKTPDGKTVPLDQFPFELYTAASIENYINQTAADFYDQLEGVRETFYSYDCQPEEPEEEPDPDGKEDASEQYVPDFSASDYVSSETKPVEPILDPSGFVYEAVPSNRLVGVTATIHQQIDGGEAVWDAADYDQVNPQVTGADGSYAWFVPEGSWKVIFTKEGYEPADSSGVPAADEDGWLPVPPPQFQVNVGMVSTTAPAVERTVAYADRIEVAFSQYMDIESVAAAVSLSRDGQPAGITVEPLDAEYDLEGAEQYATRFAVIPEDGNCVGVIDVSAGARNYADTPLEAAYTAALAAPVQRPTGITASGQTAVVYKESVALTLKLQPGIAGKSLEVESLTPALLSATETAVTTGADGAAAVTLTGLLPGSGLIRVTEPESGLSETISVRIEMPEEELGETETPAPVTAALPDGTPVTTGMTLESGAQIALRTATPGAVIRYTLNDTCPCTEDALTYTSPITITDDTVLRAAALLDGVYSDTIRLALTVSGGTEEPEDPDDPGGSGGSGGGSSSGGHAADNRPSVSTEGEGGTVTAGDGTVTIRPDEGYQIGSVTVNGETVEIPADGILKGLDADDQVAVSFERIPGEAGLPFTDVAPGAWYYEAVRYVYENGMMNGTGGRLFSPDVTTSRAMIVTILHRMEGAPAASASSFTDIAAGAYYENAVNWAAENGIVSGVSKTSFLPDDPITREQLAAILYRYARYKGYDMTGSADLSAYTDAEQIGAYAAAAMQWANGNGLILGNTSTTLNPKGHATRAEAATILMRFCQNIAE